MIAEPAAPPIIETAIYKSETARMVDEALEVKDPQDSFEVVTKTHWKEVIENMAKFTPLLNSIKAKEK